MVLSVHEHVRLVILYHSLSLSLKQVMPLHIVKWMFFSGEPISAEQAQQIGFVNDVVPVERLEQRIL